MIYLSNNSYNVEVAKVFGVCSSVFLSCIHDEGYFHGSSSSTLSLTRQYVYDRTGLDDEKQKEVEVALSECGVLSVSPVQNNANKNYYIINEELLDRIVKSPAPEEVIASSKATQFVKKRRVEPVSKRKAYINDLKKKIKTDDPLIRQYLCDWIDSVYTNPKGFLSEKSLGDNEKYLFDYAKGDTDLAISILRVAIRSGWRNIEWAKNEYEEHNKDSVSNNFVSYDAIKSDGTDVSDEEF